MRVGIVGWRGMVGSVLVQRMREEKDFDLVEPVFFSTSNAGGAAPDVGKSVPKLRDANDVAALAEMDAIVSCQGGDYTTAFRSEAKGESNTIALIRSSLAAAITATAAPIE